MKSLLVLILAIIFSCGTPKPTAPNTASMDTFVYTTINKGVVETYITTTHNDTNQAVKYFLEDASPTKIQLMIQKSRIQDY